jgi:hypothetical protein
MIATIEFAFVVFGLALLGWAITAPAGTSPSRRATGAGVGIIALIVGSILAASREKDRYGRDRYDC